MIHDATVEVTCDDCGDTIQISPEYVYSDYSGKNGHYDTRDSALHEKLEAEGWGVDGEKTFCETCKPEANEEDDDDGTVELTPSQQADLRERFAARKA